MSVENAAANISVAPDPELPKGGSGATPPSLKKADGPKKFRSFRQRVPLVLEDENGVETNYVLVEVDGDGRSEIINFMRDLADFKVDQNGNPIARQMAPREVTDNNIKIIQYSLRNEDGSAVDVAIIRKWPGATQLGIAREVMELNSLTPESAEAAKKS